MQCHFHRPPVGDVLLLPLGLPVEEVVVGHIWDAAAGLLHFLHGVGVDLSCLLKPEKLLHLLQGVLEHHEVASVLWAAVELIEIVLKEEQTHERQGVYSVLDLLVAQTVCGTHQRHFFVRPGSVVSGKPDDRRRGSDRCFPGDEVQQKDVDNQPTASHYRRKSHFMTSCSRFVLTASPLSCFSLLNFPFFARERGVLHLDAAKFPTWCRPPPPPPPHSPQSTAQTPGGRKGSSGGHSRSPG